MIYRCPNCGNQLSKPINNGIKSCSKCNVFFEANRTNHLLSSAWELLKYKNTSIDKFKFISKLNDEDATYVYNCIVNEDMCYDEFLKLVKRDDPNVNAIKEFPQKRKKIFAKLELKNSA